MQSKISVAVVDDDPLYRQGVVHAFQSSNRFEVLGEGTSASDAIRLVDDHTPDLLFLDLRLPSGVEAAETILAGPVMTKIVVLSVVEDIECVVRAFRAGVHGYLLKGISASDLIKSAEAAAVGEHCVAPQLIGNLLDQLLGRSSALSLPARVGFAVREKQVLILLAKGMSNKEIAYNMNICEKTAKYYLTNIMKKLHAKNRVEVALYAAKEISNNSNAIH